jgi:hypothetical protein
MTNLVTAFVAVVFEDMANLYTSAEKYDHMQFSDKYSTHCSLNLKLVTPAQQQNGLAAPDVES